MRELMRIRDEIAELISKPCAGYYNVGYEHYRRNGLSEALGLIEAAITERENLSLSAAGYSE